MKQLAILCLLLVTLTACATEPVKVGVITPLTGPASAYGTTIQEGIELAYQDYKAAHPSAPTIQFIYEDSQCTNRIGVAAMQKLVHADNVHAVIGVTCSAVALPAAPIAQEAHVPVIAAATSNPDLKNIGDYFFRVVPTDDLQGWAIAQKIMQDGYESVAVLALQDDYGYGLVETFTDNFEGEIVVEYFAASEQDFRTHLLRLENENPEAYVIMGGPGHHGPISEQMVELGITEQRYADGNFAQGDAVTYAGVEGTITPDLYFNLEDPLVQHLVQNIEGANAATALGYDTFNVLQQGLVACEKITSECLQQTITQTTNLKGPSGTITFDNNGDVVGKPYLWKQVTNNQLEVIQ